LATSAGVSLMPKYRSAKCSRGDGWVEGLVPVGGGSGTSPTELSVSAGDYSGGSDAAIGATRQTL